MRYPHIARCNLNLLAKLQTLIEERSITRAANRMFLSQPAMSRVFDNLQHMFHDKLLVRTRTGLEPTRLALHVYEQLENALPPIETLLRGREFIPIEANDYFRVAMNDHVAITLMPKLMKALSQMAPNIRIELFVTAENSFRMLETNALDLVIRVSQAPSPLLSEPIYRDSTVCFFRKGHPIGRRPVTAKRYLAVEHVVVSLAGSQQRTLDQALSQSGYRRNARLTIPFFAATPAIIENTDLVASLPRRLAKLFSEKSRTQFAPILMKLPSMTFRQVWHPRNDEDPAHRWLRQLIKKSACEQ